MMRIMNGILFTTGMFASIPFNYVNIVLTFASDWLYYFHKSVDNS